MPAQTDIADSVSWNQIFLSPEEHYSERCPRKENNNVDILAEINFDFSLTEKMLQDFTVHHYFTKLSKNEYSLPWRKLSARTLTSFIILNIRYLSRYCRVSFWT